MQPFGKWHASEATVQRASIPWVIDTQDCGATLMVGDVRAGAASRRHLSGWPQPRLLEHLAHRRAPSQRRSNQLAGRGEGAQGRAGPGMPGFESRRRSQGVATPNLVRRATVGGAVSLRAAHTAFPRRPDPHTSPRRGARCHRRRRTIVSRRSASSRARDVPIGAPRRGASVSVRCAVLCSKNNGRQAPSSWCRGRNMERIAARSPRRVAASGAAVMADLRPPQWCPRGGGSCCLRPTQQCRTRSPRVPDRWGTDESSWGWCSSRGVDPHTSCVI